MDPVDIVGGLHVNLYPVPSLDSGPFGVHVAINYVCVVGLIWKSNDILKSCPVPLLDSIISILREESTVHPNFRMAETMH